MKNINFIIKKIAKTICKRLLFFKRKLISLTKEEEIKLPIDEEHSERSPECDTFKRMSEQRIAEDSAISRERRYTLLLQCYGDFEQLRSSFKVLAKNDPAILHLPIFNDFFEPFIQVSQKVDYNRLLKNNFGISRQTAFEMLTHISIFFYNYRDIIHDVSKSLIYIKKEDDPIKVRNFFDNNY